MKLSLIVAIAENGVIGLNNQLPWRLPEDLKNFKRLTWGHAIVMGRKTFESLGKPLPGRLNIVVSRNPEFRAQGVQVAPSLDQSLRLAEGVDELFVIGGSALFKEALPRVERLYVTRIHQVFAGDVYFPDLDLQGLFRTVSETRHQSAGESRLSYSFIEAERKR